VDRRLLWFLGIGLAVALLVAGGLSLLASGDPDGLERVAIDQGFDDAATEHALADSLLADYGVSGVEGDAGTTIAGVVGVVVTLIAVVGLLYAVSWIRRVRRRSA
jgi:cobalt/nickel transport system permease protein